MSLFTDNCLFNSNGWDFLTKADVLHAISTKVWDIFAKKYVKYHHYSLYLLFAFTDNRLFDANCWDFLTRKYKNDHQVANFWKLVTSGLENDTKHIVSNAFLIVPQSQLLGSNAQ